ncbi:MAG: AAA family ATPase [Syntrophobacteraceae bacterium]|jgi:predicted ATPase
MKIITLSVSGYRSLADVIWAPGDLNVLIGPNGAGKSNLLRLLELISISAQGRLGKYIQNMGGMEPLVWDGLAEFIKFMFKASPVDKTRSVQRDSLTYILEMDRLGKSSAYRIGHELLANYHRVETGEREGPLILLERQGLNARVLDENERALIASEESMSEEETLLSVATGPFIENRDIPPFQAQVASWSVYHDLHVNRDAPIRQAAVTRTEKRVDPDGQNLIPVLHTLYTGDRDFKKDIDSAMRAAFGDDYEELVFAPAADQRIQLRVQWKSLRRAQTAADLSDGTLRFLFLLTVLASPMLAPVIAIDEPETGLHPSMLPIVAEYAVDASQRAQVILTTHSPQFLNAFGDTIPVTTVTECSDGATQLRTLDGDALKEWLKEYSLGSLFLSSELEEME